MRQIILFALTVAIMLSSISCNNEGNKKVIAQTLDSSKVSVYYFHFTRRCVTCLAVEENARRAVEELFPNEIKTGEYSFSSLNLDEASKKEIANTYGVGGQTLLIVRGGKKIDITDKGFLNANDLDKMKEEIKSAVDKVLF
jgi:hypothetical protein